MGWHEGTAGGVVAGRRPDALRDRGGRQGGLQDHHGDRWDSGNQEVCRIYFSFKLNLFQVNPDFDTEIDQWVFVGQLFRAINLSPVGDYDFKGIDTREYQVLAYEVLIALPQKP